jgi:hypothetical protein
MVQQYLISGYYYSLYNSNTPIRASYAVITLEEVRSLFKLDVKVC